MPTGATAMTFDSLVQDLKDYTEQGSNSNTKLATQIPKIINNAERSLAMRLKIQGYRTVLNGTLLMNSPSYPKPQGWRNTVSFSVGTNGPGQTQFNNKVYLRMRRYEYIRMKYPDPTAPGTPEMYSDYDLDHWVFGPTPDQNYPFETIVYLLPDLLSPANQQNYLTRYVPNLLLYQCLTNLEPFLKNDPRMVLWKQMLEQEFEALNAEEIAKLVDRAQAATSA
jgi:hypothetical protein